MAYRRTERVMQRLAARRDAIIAAARGLASEQGLQAVQIVPVAERAGIAAGTVYRYFPAKTELVAALVTALSERELAAMRQAADAAPGPLSALAAAIATLGARALRDRRLAWAMLAEPVDAEVGAMRVEYRKALARELESRLGAAIAESHLPEQDTAQTARALVGALLEGLIGPLASEVGDDPVKQREAVQMLTLFALRGFGLVDARARGLVVQTPLPAANEVSAT